MKKDDDSSVSIKQIIVTAIFLTVITFGGLKVYRIGYVEEQNTIHTIESANLDIKEYEEALVANTEDDVVYTENLKFLASKIVETEESGSVVSEAQQDTVEEEIQKEVIQKEVVKEETLKQEVSEEENDKSNSEKVVSRGNFVREQVPTEYIKTIDVKATAYCLCKKCCGKSTSHPAYGITASGLKIIPGTGMKVVASDPSVIPLGTEVYIEGLYGASDYGYAIVADTGSAIKNLKIDLYMDTHQMALNWGVKTVRVYILDK